MKKIFAFILAVILMGSCACAEDYAAMTDQELSTALQSIRLEMIKRYVDDAPDDMVLIDNDEITIYFTGKASLIMDYLDIEIIFVNKTNQALSCNFTHISINGWGVSALSTYINSTMAGSRTKSKIRLAYKDAECAAFSEMNDIQVRIETVNEKFSTREYGPITFIFSERLWNQ